MYIRHRTASFVITSNTAVEEWLGLFDDPILGNSACWQPAKVAHFETREIMGWMEVWRAP